MNGYFHKRLAIERGELTTWPRRGRARRAGHAAWLDTLIEFGLCATGLYGRGHRNALAPELKHIRVCFEALPAAFHGFRILHLSDLHIDGWEALARLIHHKLKDVAVDLCVLTGDYRFGISGPCHPIYAPMQHILDAIQARHGYVGTLGNHDVSEMLPAFEEIGVTMLLNRSLEIRRGDHSIWLAGVDDPHYFGCDDLPGALAGVPQQAFKILLVHTPELFAEAAQHGVHLYLCGHTHGGQLCLPWLGPVRTHANCPRKFARGLWCHDSVIGYTSPGVGCSGVRARLLCPPELVLIELHSSDRLASA